jgi:8-oxo-dGTP pyrophosphatase MutT (NUDIX family)
MKNEAKNANDGIIKAAGGLVWRVRNGSKEIAIVHRTRYAKDEWTLPKGKLKKGEGWQEAAVREVCEEIGCRRDKLRKDDFAGGIVYLVKDQPKVVLFWNMTLDQDLCGGEKDREVDQVKWLPLGEAAELLVHEKEKALLKQYIRD